MPGLVHPLVRQRTDGPAPGWQHLAPSAPAPVLGALAQRYRLPLDTGHIDWRHRWGVSGGEAVDGPAPYFQWGFIQISLANLVVIGVMLLLFVLALVLPFPSHAERHDRDTDRR